MGQHRRQVLHFDFDAMTTVFPLRDVERVLEATGRLSQRERKLPAPTMVYLIITLGLMVSTGAKEVLRRLLDQVRQRDWVGWVEPASEAAICKARKRLGYEPLKELFEQVARPIATRRTRGAWFRGRRLVTVDGSTLQVQDSSANARAFGRPKTAKRPAAYPVIRFVMLIENGTRVPFAAAMDRWRRSETALARRVIDRLGKGMLCLADRLFYSYDLWTQAVATGADLLWRVPSYVTLPRLKELSGPVVFERDSFRQEGGGRTVGSSYSGAGDRIHDQGRWKARALPHGHDIVERPQCDGHGAGALVRKTMEHRKLAP